MQKWGPEPWPRRQSGVRTYLSPLPGQAPASQVLRQRPEPLEGVSIRQTRVRAALPAAPPVRQARAQQAEEPPPQWEAWLERRRVPPDVQQGEPRAASPPR